MNFEQILWNKVFCRMFGLVVMEGMTPSGHLSNINEIENHHFFTASIWELVKTAQKLTYLNRTIGGLWIQVTNAIVLKQISMVIKNEIPYWKYASRASQKWRLHTSSPFTFMKKYQMSKNLKSSVFLQIQFIRILQYVAELVNCKYSVKFFDLSMVSGRAKFLLKSNNI